MLFSLTSDVAEGPEVVVPQVKIVSSSGEEFCVLTSSSGGDGGSDALH